MTDRMTDLPLPSGRAALLAALILQRSFGADEALSESPVDRLDAPRAPMMRVPPRPESPSESRLTESRPIESRPPESAGSTPPEALFLARTATHRLAPVLVENAPFMLVGEVPDADEDRSGALFAGPAGALLDRMLASIGRERSRLSIAPAVPWRPPGGRGVSAAEMRACRPLLLEAIARARPALLVTMGATSLRMLLGDGAVLARLRGAWTEIPIPGLESPVPLLPMRHPLQLAASPAFRRDAWNDLLVLDDRLRAGGGARGEGADRGMPEP